MAPSRNRESTPDDPAEELRTRYFAVTKDANIDQKTSQHVWTTFETMRDKYSMEGDSMEWLLPGAYAHAISQKPAAFESKIILIKLLKATGLSVPNFYTRLRKWVDLASLSPVARDVFSQAERYFQISRTIFERFEAMFVCVFRDPLDADMLNNVFQRARLLRSRQKVSFPKIVQSVDVYVFAWDLFVLARRSAVVMRDDLVSCYHLLICVLDCICSNILAMRRSELLNPGCTILPKMKASTEEGEEEEKGEYFSLRPYLCAKFEGINNDCERLYTNAFIPLMQHFIQHGDVIATGPTFLQLMVEDNFEKNMKSVNGSYENDIRIECGADERILLVSQDINSPGPSGDPVNIIDVIDTMKERRRICPTANRKMELNDFKTPTPITTSATAVPTPLTPTSSCSALERREAQESVKSPPLQTAVDLVTQLTHLVAGRTPAPSAQLKETLMALYERDVWKEFNERAVVYRERLVSAYMTECDPTGMAEPYIRQRFIFAQIWYFRLLEDMLLSEMKRHPPNTIKLKKLAESTKFQTSIFALAVEMVLFSYNCSKMFPWPLEVLDLAPYDFVRVIEPVVLLEQLPKLVIKHLGRVEETVYEEMVWKGHSPVWNEISTDDHLTARDVCWSHHLEENPASIHSTTPSEGNGPVRRSGALLPVTAPSTPNAPNTPNTPSTPSTPSTVQNSAGVSAAADGAVMRPPRNSGICLFFRKIYVLAGVRLREICNKLGFDGEIERKYHVFQRMFTLFENTLTQHTEILKDRHLDQILLCCAYVVAKLETVNGLDKSFHLIMNAYRYQAQAESKVYRSVLISSSTGGSQPETRRRSHVAGGSEASESAASSSSSSSSSSSEVRADIITFYNTVFVRVMQGFIAKFSPKKKGQATPGGIILSPVPKIPGRETRRQIHPNAKIWLSPRKQDPVPTPPPSNGRVLTFTFGVTGQIDALISANSAAVAAAARKQVTAPVKRVASAQEPPSPAAAGPSPKRGRRATVALSRSSSALSLANSLPPPLAVPSNFPSFTSTLAYQDTSMPDSL